MSLGSLSTAFAKSLIVLGEVTGNVTALRNWQVESRRVAPALPAEPPLQSVLIPAHNEAKVIAETHENLRWKIQDGVVMLA